MAAFMRFRSTSFAELLKWMYSSLSNRAIFFREIFLFKESFKKLTLSLRIRRGNSIIAFDHVFIITFYATTLQKPYFIDPT